MRKLFEVTVVEPRTVGKRGTGMLGGNYSKIDFLVELGGSKDSPAGLGTESKSR